MSGTATCRVRAVPVCERGVLHPLAHRRGIELLGLMVAAQQHWKPVSRAGKAALSLAYRRALAGARDGDVVPLPPLPETVHARTVAALERRGLAADGALTPLAVEVLGHVEPPARRPVETRLPVGDLL